MSENAVEIRNISKKFKNFSLDNVSLDIPQGCITGLIGENGAGKSTLIKIILNLIKRENGSVKVFGMDNIKNNIDIKKRTGVVFDEANFPDVMKVKNISAVMKNIYDNWNCDLFMKYIKQFSIPENIELRQFSKGMKMKLMIAAALSHNPDLLILDEATNGLDPVIRDEILDVFLEFIQNEKKSILISSHITSDLEKISDYIAFIHNGKILFNEPKDELSFRYGILKCGLAEFDNIPKDSVIGFRKNQFGVEALVKRNMIHGKKSDIFKPSLEDIMLYTVRGQKS